MEEKREIKTSQKKKRKRQEGMRNSNSLSKPRVWVQDLKRGGERGETKKHRKKKKSQKPESLETDETRFPTSPNRTENASSRLPAWL